MIAGTLIIDTLVVEIIEKCGARATIIYIAAAMHAKFLLHMLH